MNEGQGPRLAVNKTEAATALGVSVDFFDRHLAHELAGVRRGRKVLYPVRELERWLERASERMTAGHAACLPHLVLLHPHVLNHVTHLTRHIG